MAAEYPDPLPGPGCFSMVAIFGGWLGGMHLVGHLENTVGSWVFWVLVPPMTVAALLLAHHVFPRPGA